MSVQHQIRHQFTRPGSVHHVIEVLDADDIQHRTALAEHPCADCGHPEEPVSGDTGPAKAKHKARSATLVVRGQPVVFP